MIFSPLCYATFSADAKIFFKNRKIYFSHENIKNLPSKVAYFKAQSEKFQYCQPAQNQLKYHTLFHKNGSPRDLFIRNDFSCCCQKAVTSLKSVPSLSSLILHHTGGWSLLPVKTKRKNKKDQVYQ